VPFVCCEASQVCVAQGEACPSAGSGPSSDAMRDASSEAPQAIACDSDDAGAALEVIDTMEMGSSLVQGAVWTAFGDDSDGGVVTAQVTALEAPRCGSRYAMLLHASGFVNWGASLALVPRSVPDDSAVGGHPEPFDARAYVALRFWARSGSARSIEMRLDVHDRHTDPGGGLCNPNQAAADRCYKPFVLGFKVTSAWQLFTMPFDKVVQMPSWPGYQSEDGLALDALYGINWTILSNRTGTATDVWIDDVAYVRKEAPTP
jgi:hypothetical protein